jgi:hypothetical protein
VDVSEAPASLPAGETPATAREAVPLRPTRTEELPLAERLRRDWEIITPQMRW